MTSIVLIDKSGKVSDKKVKQYDETDLYKKAGFKKADGFVVQTTWENSSVNGKTYSKIVMYGKKSGNAGKENQYEFPPPMDTVLCFGTVILVHKDENNTTKDLRSSEWTSIYEYLYGGFEDTRASNTEDEEEEIEEIDASLLTKQGYMKDDFIVEDNECEEEDFEYESELSEDDYFD